MNLFDSKFKVLSLFSGIGGIDLGLERTNFFETVAFCEIDKDCHKVLNKHWPKIPIYSDVSNLDLSSLKQDGIENIDVIAGGFPCTDISVAGKQKGLIDDSGKTTRSGLWFEYKRLIGEIKPRYVLIENVANLRGNGLVTVLQDLWSLGYDAEWQIISARDVGAPHLRERIWIVAYPNCKLLREQSGRWIGENGGGETLSGIPSKTGDAETANTDDLRLWRSFTPEEEKSKWWASSTSEFSDWWKTMPNTSGIYDGISNRLYENARRQRIRQLGNSVVLQIVTFIGNQIADYEARKCL